MGLDLCWEEGRLRFYDPVTQRYLSTFMEESAARTQETEARSQAEARVRELEEELRRLRNP